MFEFFKNLYDDIFGSDDDDEEELSSFSPDDPDDFSFSPETDGIDLSEFIDLQDRLIDAVDIVEGDEFVNDFYSMQEALDYVEGAPENILKISMDESFEVYHVYRIKYE